MNSIIFQNASIPPKQTRTFRRTTDSPLSPQPITYAPREVAIQRRRLSGCEFEQLSQQHIEHDTLVLLYAVLGVVSGRLHSADPARGQQLHTAGRHAVLATGNASSIHCGWRNRTSGGRRGRRRGCWWSCWPKRSCGTRVDPLEA